MMTARKALQRNWWFDVILVFISISSCLAARAQTEENATALDTSIELSQEDLAWVEKNPIVRFTGDPDWLPFEAFDSSGEYTGIVSDILSLIEMQTGLQIERVKPDNWSHALQLARDGEVSIISGDAADTTLNESFTPTRSYLTSNIVIVMRADHPPVNHLEQISDLNIAVVRDYGYVADLRKNYPNIKFKEVDTVADGFDALFNQSIDALLISNVTATYNISGARLDALNIVGQTSVFMKATIFVSSSEPVLNRIFEQALFNIPVRRRNEIFDNWIDSGRQTAAANAPLSMTPQEQRWLKQHPTLLLAGDPHWLPFEAFDGNSNYIGIVAEHVRLIEQLLGVNLEIVRTQSWSESVSMARSSSVDILSETSDSDLNNQLLFSKPYLTSRIAMVMRQNNNYANHLSDVAGKRIGAVQDYGYLPKIRRAYPDIEFIETPTLRDGLEKVSTGQIDVMLCNLPQCTYQITSASLNNIRIIGPTEFETELALGVRPELAPLVPLLNRAIDTISEPQRQQILRSWIQEPILDARRSRYLSLLLWLTALLFVAALVRDSWLRLRLRRQKLEANKIEAEREYAVEANRSKTEFLAAIGHEVRTPMNGVIGMLDNLSHTTLSEGQHRAVAVIRDSAGALLGVVDDMLDFSKLEIGQLKIRESAARLDHVVESVVNNHAISARKNSLKFSLQVDPALRRGVQLDPLRVRQILSNLISNAIKYTHYGSVNVSAKVIARDETGVEFLLQVQDTGIGIAQNDQSKLFSNFIRADNKKSTEVDGTGLGLSISKQLADKMDGRIDLKSALGSGTTIGYKQHAVFADDEPLKDGASSHRARIVCQNDTLTDLVCRYLKDIGIDYEDPESSSSTDSYTTADFLITDHPITDDSLHHSLNTSNWPETKTILLDPELTPDQSQFEPHMCSISAYPLLPSSFRMAVRIVSGQYLATEPVAPSAPPENRARILVVEDHPTNQFVLRGQLDLLGYEVSVVDNGEAGLLAWRRGRYDAIVTDISMPVLDGYKMTRLIRAEQPSTTLPIPIVGLTAMNGVQQDDRWRRSGMNQCLIKPIDLVSLDNCLRLLLDSKTSEPDRSEEKIESDTQIDIDLDINLLKRFYTHQDRIASLLNTFLADSRRDIDGIREALKTGNAQVLKNRAHALAGASSVIFAPRLVNACKRIAECDIAVPPAKFAVLVQEVEEAMTAFRLTAEKWLVEPQIK